MKQVILVEDEAMLRTIAIEVLEDAGFLVFEAGDGKEALEILTRWRQAITPLAGKRWSSGHTTISQRIRIKRDRARPGP